jgi:UDP-N-acetylmuramoyl-tripeptide--D-alanyl-D-alanine ligase
MWDYDYLREMSSGIPHIVKYGTADADVTGKATPSEPFLQVALADGSKIQTQLVGDYNLPNILAAVTVGRYFKVPDEQIKKAIEDYSPSNSRSQLLTVQSNKIILDAYNANPSSMKAAIENFALIPADNKILVLGGMAELGEDSMSEHQQIVELISKFKWNAVLLVGGDFLKINHPFTSLPNAAAAKEWLQEHPFSNSYLLVKGSRSMQMEKVL